tara:strand:+ start:429 stop:662 length:234 start_codon:yes stop_codon:yes gene_type:complete
MELLTAINNVDRVYALVCFPASGQAVKISKKAAREMVINAGHAKDESQFVCDDIVWHAADGTSIARMIGKNFGLVIG